MMEPEEQEKRIKREINLTGLIGYSAKITEVIAVFNTE